MAEGRILSRRISRSFKVSALKSDTARLFFTWLIPYLDVDGRMEAEPALIKADLFPLLDHINTRAIKRLLGEIAAAGLIVLYECNGRKYLQLNQFETFQKNLRKDRETPSKIPPPLRSNSGGTPEEVRSNDGEGPAQANIREVNIIKAKAPEEDEPVDNSEKKKAPSEKNNGNGEDKSAGQKIGILFHEIRNKNPDPRYMREVQLFLENNIRANPKAIIHCLESLKNSKKTVHAPGAYLGAAMTIENGKYNAMDHEAKAAEYKKPGMVSLGAILGEINRRSHT
jgi:hypothetical protein